jgi:hypothetical protein
LCFSEHFNPRASEADGGGDLMALENNRKLPGPSQRERMCINLCARVHVRFEVGIDMDSMKLDSCGEKAQRVFIGP